jgi:ERF superfamily
LQRGEQSLPRHRLSSTRLAWQHGVPVLDELLTNLTKAGRYPQMKIPTEGRLAEVHRRTKETKKRGSVVTCANAKTFLRRPAYFVLSLSSHSDLLEAVMNPAPSGPSWTHAFPSVSRMESGARKNAPSSVANSTRPAKSAYATNTNAGAAPMINNGTVTAATNGLPPVATALARVASEVGAVGKASRNTQQGFNFRGIDDVLNAVGPVLHKHGVVVVPEVQNIALETVEVGQKRTPMRSAVLTIRFRFVGPAGDHVDATVVGEAMDSGDKALSKAQSVGLRIALLQVLTLPTHEPEPDKQIYERSPVRRTREKPRPDPVIAVINLAREAGVGGDALIEDVAGRYEGRTLDDLTEEELRAEWKHWRAQKATAS